MWHSVDTFSSITKIALETYPVASSTLYENSTAGKNIKTTKNNHII